MKRIPMDKRDLQLVAEIIRDDHINATHFCAVECERQQIGSVSWTAWRRRPRHGMPPLYYSYTAMFFLGDLQFELLTDSEFAAAVIEILTTGEPSLYPFIHKERDIDIVEPPATGYRVHAESFGNHAGSTHGHRQNQNGHRGSSC